MFIKVFKPRNFHFFMECFIKKIWQEKGEESHKYFVRFGKGNFEQRALLNLQKTSKIKLRGSFEWANDFVKIIAELGDFVFSGIILSKEEISELSEFPNNKKTGLVQYEINKIESKKVQEIENKVYVMLLDCESESQEVKLKIKKKLPKPGKSGGGKVNDKFCQLELDLKYWGQVADFFMLPDCKKCKISHTIVIEDIILPEKEKDPAKMREMAKRKGKIIRNLEVDKQEKKEEKEFIA